MVSVINDIVTDHRVLKTCRTLATCGYEVLVVGRSMSDSLPLNNWPFRTKRMRLLLNKGPFFYLFFNLRLFFVLLFTKAELLYANDLDTLLPNFLVSRLKKIPLIFDSHELFCEVPELQESPAKKWIWETLEKWIVPKLRHCITVNDSIAGIFEKKYGVKFHAVRNISDPLLPETYKSRAELNLPENKRIVLLQGAGINIDRGAEELVEAMKQVDDTLLLIIGSGDVWNKLESTVEKEGLGEKVKLIRRIPKEQLVHFTANADIGISIDKNTNPNYYYSLPNKIFDYLQAGLPVLASRLPEIEKIVTNYRCGEFIESHEPGHLALRTRAMLESPQLKAYSTNALTAAKELNWANEQQKLVAVIRAAGAADQ